MSFDERFNETVLTMLSKGETVTVSSIAKNMNVDRNSIYYRIRRVVDK